MKARELDIPGAWEITPTLHGDSRGVFFEWFTDAGFISIARSPGGTVTACGSPSARTSAYLSSTSSRVDSSAPMPTATAATVSTTGPRNHHQLGGGLRTCADVCRIVERHLAEVRTRASADEIGWLERALVPLLAASPRSGLAKDSPIIVMLSNSP